MKNLFFLFTFLFLSHLTQAQGLLDREIDFQVEQVSLEDALIQLLSVDGVNLTYSNNLIPNDVFVSIRAQKETLRKVLTDLLSDTNLTFQVAGNQIVIIEAPIQRPIRKYTLSGFVEDMETGEVIIGANVYSPKYAIGTGTNEYGFYSLTLPEGDHQLIYSYLGYEQKEIEVNVSANKKLNTELKSAFLTQVVVTPKIDSFFIGTSPIGTDQIIIENIDRLPNLGGESDIVRFAHTLPGVQTGADGFGNISVRGGNADQNHFLLDGVPVYNSLHAVGIYSVYNSSAIRSAKFYKGVFPAKYGGRISSVLDVQMKEGNRKKHLIETDIGLTSGKLTVEGPFGKNKNGSFFISGRRAFFDFYSIPITRENRARNGIDGYVGYFFYDLNFKINQKVSEKDRIYFSYYHGEDDYTDIRDQFGQVGDTLVFLSDNDTVIWGNTIASFRWNHVFNSKLFSNTTLTFSRFFYESNQLADLKLIEEENTILRDILFLQYRSNNEDLAAKIDFDYHPNENHKINFGVSAIKHKFQPGIISFDEAAQLDTIDLDTIGRFDPMPLRSLELDAYVQDEISFGKFLKANLGLRATAYEVNGYWQFSLQPRILLEFLPENKLSYSFAIGRHTQNLHLLSPSTFGLPKDLWVGATELRKPQQSWQVVGGLKYKLPFGMEFELEGYYKKMDNLLIFNEVLLTRVNSVNWQFKVSEGEGWAYGAELFLQKKLGKTMGWMSYTLAWSERQFDNKINDGRRFPSRLDRRHNFNFQLVQSLGERFEFSFGWNYASGSAYTQPTGFFIPLHPPFPQILVIESINNARLPAYHRLDLGLHYFFKKGNLHHSIKLGTYNTYNRKNPIYRTHRNDIVDGSTDPRTVTVQVNLLPIFPSIRYKVLFN